MKITASAVIDHGATTNRVRMADQPTRVRPRAQSRAPKRVPTPRRSQRRHVSSPAVVVGVSMTQLELAILDLAAASRNVSRSEYVRERATLAVSAPWFIRIEHEPGPWCRWPRRKT